MLMVVERLPETDPDIEQAQAAADATKEAIGHHGCEAPETKAADSCRSTRASRAR